MMTPLPDLETASRATGIAPEKIQLLRDYRENPRQYNRKNHPFPIELCPTRSCPLLESFDYAKEHILRIPLRDGRAFEQMWNMRNGAPGASMRDGLTDLDRQYAEMFSNIWGIDKTETPEKAKNIRCLIRFGIVKVGQRQKTSSHDTSGFHYDVLPSPHAISLVVVNDSPTECVKPGDLRPSDPDFEKYITQNNLIIQPPAMTIYAFGGAITLHAVGKMQPDPQREAQWKYRCFFTTDLHI